MATVYSVNITWLTARRPATELAAAGRGVLLRDAGHQRRLQPAVPAGKGEPETISPPFHVSAPRLGSGEVDSLPVTRYADGGVPIRAFTSSRCGCLRPALEKCARCSNAEARSAYSRR